MDYGGTSVSVDRLYQSRFYMICCAPNHHVEHNLGYTCLFWYLRKRFVKYSANSTTLTTTNKKEITQVWWSDALLTFHSDCCSPPLSHPLPFLSSLLLQPQKFDSTPYNSQGHLHLRPEWNVIVEKLELVMSRFEPLRSLLIVGDRWWRCLVTAELG